MIRQLTLDFNPVIDGSPIRANARRTVDGAEFEVGMTVVVDDDGSGVTQAEVVEHDHASGSMVLRLIGDWVGERPQPA